MTVFENLRCSLLVQCKASTGEATALDIRIWYFSDRGQIPEDKKS